MVQYNRLKDTQILLFSFWPNFRKPISQVIFLQYFGMSQLCPSCKTSYLQLQKSKLLVCSNPKCKYIQFSPITFQNDVRNFDNQRQVQSRFNGNYNVELQNGGQKIEFEGDKADEYNKFIKQDKFVKIKNEAKKNLHRWGNKLHLSQAVQDLASIRFGQIYRIVDADPRITCTQKNMAVYALYNAAFEQGVYFIEQRLIKKADITEDEWINVKRNLTRVLLGRLFVPKEETLFYCIKYCNEKGIKSAEVQAIKEAVEKFRIHEIRNGEKWSTEAACIIWLVLKNSRNYSKDPEYTLANIAKFFEGKSEATVKKFYNNNVAHKEKELLPVYADMINGNI